MAPRGRKLTREEVPQYLLDNWRIRRTPYTLAKEATVGGGPKFYKAGNRVLYEPADLDEWATTSLGKAKTSTSAAA
jgi:hypothetical protein